MDECESKIHRMHKSFQIPSQQGDVTDSILQIHL